MAKLPIHVKKVKIKNHLSGADDVKYLVVVSDRGTYWEQTAIVERSDLLRFKNELEALLAESNTAEILKLTEEQAAVIDKAHATDPLCKDCTFKMTDNCKTCLFEMQSPLERKLFLEFRKEGIYFQPQYALNWQGQNISIAGKEYHSPDNNFKEVLTVVDFYIEKRNLRLCVYTDGHTYHERTEEQATRDRNIDRTLQELGFLVLRFTGKEINEQIDKVVGKVKSWLDRAYQY